MDWGSVNEAERFRKPFLKEDQMLYMEKLNGCKHLIDLFFFNGKRYDSYLFLVKKKKIITKSAKSFRMVHEKINK